MKITCTIDNNKVSVEKGSTILYAAQTAGIHIPTLCNLEGFPPFTSCMICVVEDLSTGKLVPSCTEQVKEGMAINTLSDSVYKARQDALNLLLSEHVGECTAPCTRTCPAHPDIPRVKRYINKGMVPDAL